MVLQGTDPESTQSRVSPEILEYTKKKKTGCRSEDRLPARSPLSGHTVGYEEIFGPILNDFLVPYP